MSTYQFFVSSHVQEFSIQFWTRSANEDHPECYRQQIDHYFAWYSQAQEMFLVYSLELWVYRAPAASGINECPQALPT